MFTPTSPSSKIPNGTLTRKIKIDELFHRDNQSIQSLLDASVSNIFWIGKVS